MLFFLARMPIEEILILSSFAAELHGPSKCTCTRLGFCTLFNMPSWSLPSCEIETKLAYCASCVLGASKRARVVSVPRNISHNIITPTPRRLVRVRGGFPQEYPTQHKNHWRARVAASTVQYGWHAFAPFSAGGGDLCTNI